MVSRGLADPRLPTSAASSSAAALAIFASTRGQGLGEDNEGLLEGHFRETLNGHISPSTAPRLTGEGVKAALMASLLQRAAISVTDRSDTRGNTPMAPPNKGVGNPIHSPGDSGVDGTAGTNPSSGSDTAVSSASARRIIGRSCTEIYALLLSAREEVNGVGGDDRLGYTRLHQGARFERAVSPVDIITPNGRWQQQQQRQRRLRAVCAAAAFHLAPTLESFLCCCCCDEQFPTMDHTVDGETCRAASDLLELLDQYAIDEEMRGAEKGSGDGSVLSPVSRMLREVRGMCRGRAEDRASASRRLVDMLLRMQGGREVRCGVGILPRYMTLLLFAV